MGGYVEWYFEWDAQDWVSERTSLTIVCVCVLLAWCCCLYVCIYYMIWWCISLDIVLDLTWVSLNIIHEWFALWSTIEWQDLLHDNQLNWIGYDVRSCAWVEIVAEQGQRSVTTTKEMTCITITIIDIPSALETSLDIHSIPRIQYVPILSKSTQSLISWLVVVVGRQWVAF